VVKHLKLPAYGYHILNFDEEAEEARQSLSQLYRLATTARIALFVLKWKKKHQLDDTYSWHPWYQYEVMVSKFDVQFYSDFSNSLWIG